MQRLLLACAALFALAAALIPAFAQDAAAPSRDEVLAALAVSDAQLPNPNLSPQPPQQAAPVEKNTYLTALEKLASGQPDPELTATLLRYQLAYLSPDNAVPARVMGVVFFAQPDLFVRVYNSFPAAARVILSPYLKFGFERAVEGRNPSLPQVKVARKKFDALQGSLMNARSRDDVPPTTPAPAAQ